jgi:hypothetical protein
MSSNNAQDVTLRQAHLLDDLKSLLEKQIELVHKANIAEAESLSERADALVVEIAQTRLLEHEVNSERREQLRRLYEKLRLTIATQKAGVAEKLAKVRKGKRTIGTYRSSV